MKMRKLVALACLASSIFANNVFGQKQAEVQEKSIFAPAEIKVDGKPTEWNNSFQAFNKLTQIHYTLANDQKNLYLVVQCNDRVTINKLMRGGISLTVNTDGKKKEKDGACVTFPVPSVSDLPTMMRSMRAAMGTDRQSATSATALRKADSILSEANKKRLMALKEIQVLGVKGITDTLISIYNEYGLKARASFDASNVFTYELAVPMAAFGISADRPKEFLYNIRLNGAEITGVPENISMMVAASSGAASRGAADLMSMMTKTDFWGKYIIAKK